MTNLPANYQSPASPHEIEKALVNSLPASVNLMLYPQYTSGCEEFIGYRWNGADNLPVPTRDDIATALALVEAALKPTPPTVVKRELAWLRAVTVSRKTTPEDWLLRLAAYAEELMRYPASVTACREYFEKAGCAGVMIFCLHDFDFDGFKIAATLHQDTKRYQFKQRPRIIDIGLRLVDVERLGLESEPVVFDKSPAAVRKNLERYGATEAEIEFLLTGIDDKPARVELNAMTTPQLLELIETALITHGVHKIIPDRETLAAAYRNEIEYQRAQEAIEKAIQKARKESGEIPIPDDLAEQVASYLKDNPTAPWKEAIRAVARKRR
jgi:hypothetical protein